MSQKKEKQEPPGSVLDRPLDRGLLSVDFDPAEMGMAPITADLLVPGEKSPADMFLAVFNREERRVEMEPACPKGHVFQAKWRDRLRKAEQGKLYVRINEAAAVGEYFQRCAGSIINDPGLTRRKRIGVVQEMAGLNLKLLFGSDLSPRDLEKAVSQGQQTVSQVARNPQLLDNLSSVLRSDYSIYSHCVNVSLLAMAFGRYLGLSEGRIHSLGMGGLFHDLGMARLPRPLLEKKDKLSSEEMAHFHRHPRLGYQMLQYVSAAPYDVLMIVLHHHENADGTGYPSRLKAERTPYLARVVKVVDAYDAMTSERSYHDPQSPYQAANQLIESMSAQFGQDLVPAFIRFLGSPFMEH
ncbi:MAG: HD domain-containing protein [Desulfarculaceae bacterium]|jgi:HD-GYP domain-containing protein (c-di-GMP phosphodiesterase class II)